MYLTKKTGVKNWNFTKPEDQFEVSVKRDGKPYDGIKSERVSQISEDVAYWRKFNALHIWFVENVQGGEDNCAEYYVERARLEELVDVLKKIGNDEQKAQQLLPTQSGFFFGDTSYDEYYFSEVQRTLETLEELLKEEEGDFYYQSSW